jgi:tetratricopeptide (TPR) repeat protein
MTIPSSHRDGDSAPKLSSAGEQAWTEFRYHVEWSDGFSLIFLFSSHPLLASLFHQRLQAICATRVSVLQPIAPQRAEQLAEEVLAAIRNRDDRFQALAAPLWIEAGISGDPGWLSACDLMLARLNEYRDMLRSRINRPVIISLPGGYRQRAREIAPDLWSIRTYSLDLDDIRASAPQLPPTESESASHPAPEPPPSIKSAEAILAEWQRLVSRDATGSETRTAGWRATEAALALGRLEQAREIGEQLVLQARQELQVDPTETALRDLSVSLDKIGDTALQQGDLEGAKTAYRESLSIIERLRYAFPNNQEYDQNRLHMEQKLNGVKQPV